MPIYEYACAKCEREFEVEQRITEDPVKTCPHCRSRRVKRLISNTSFVLKGSGWYSDLYSSSKGETAEDKGGEGKADEKSGGDNVKKSEKSEKKESSSSGASSESGSSDTGGKSKKKTGKKGSKKSAA